MSKSPRITEAEWAVMEIVWDDPPVTAKDVHASIGAERMWSLHTVKTLLARLLEKGVVRHELEGKRFLYTAAHPRDDAVRAESASFLARVHRGAASPLLARFLGEGKLSKRELASVRRLLDEMEEQA